MGLKDRLKSAKKYLSSPMEVSMLGDGSDERVHAGRTARVVVVVKGEDDGSVDGIGLQLRRSGAANGYVGFTYVDLVDVPKEAGRHELDVPMPPDLLPSSVFARYEFLAKVRRKGLEPDGVSPVVVVSSPDALWWPNVRSGTDGPDDARIQIELDTPTADMGSPVAGRVVIHAMRDLGKEAVTLALGPEIDALVGGGEGTKLKRQVRFKEAAKLELAPKQPLGASQRLELPFELEVPGGYPPTLTAGEWGGAHWQVRVQRGDTTAWATVGVLDPESLGAPPKQGSSYALYDLLNV